MGLWVNTLICVVLTAYVDESYRRRRSESVCVYTLVGVVVADADLDGIRSELRGLRNGKDKTRPFIGAANGRSGSRPSPRRWGLCRFALSPR